MSVNDRGIGAKSIWRTYRVIKLTPDKLIRLRTRVRRKVPYDQLISLLVEGHEVFVPDMDRRVASHVRRELSKRIGVEVESYPSELDGMNGYTFKLSIVDEYLKERRSIDIEVSSSE